MAATTLRWWWWIFPVPKFAHKTITPRNNIDHDRTLKNLPSHDHFRGAQGSRRKRRRSSMAAARNRDGDGETVMKLVERMEAITAGNRAKFFPKNGSHDYASQLRRACDVQQFRVVHQPRWHPGGGLAVETVGLIGMVNEHGGWRLGCLP